MCLARIPQAVLKCAVCALVVVGALCFQGCEKEKPQPYAELDAKFPKGRPEIAGVEERGRDAAYQERIKEGAKQFAKLSTQAVAAREKADAFGGELTKLLKKRLGTEPPQALIDAELAKNEHYQRLLKVAQEAEAKAESQRQANTQVIRDRMWEPVREYERMKAEADAQAKAAGLPVRTFSPMAPGPVIPPAARKAKAETPAPEAQKKPAPTVKDLAKETGIPVAKPQNP